MLQEHFSLNNYFNLTKVSFVKYYFSFLFSSKITAIKNNRGQLDHEEKKNDNVAQFPFSRQIELEFTWNKQRFFTGISHET